ncbi:MAG: aldehyde dehydrogenase family protein, partial [Microbacterium gubbeenense]
MNDVERALLSTISGKLFIAGEWVDATGGATLDVRDPATNEVIAQVADATADDATHALDAAVDAQAEWAATAPRRRSEILRRAWELVQERKHDLALVMTLEMGKPVSESLGEVGYGGEFLRWFSEE